MVTAMTTTTESKWSWNLKSSKRFFQCADKLKAFLNKCEQRVYVKMKSLRWKGNDDVSGNLESSGRARTQDMGEAGQCCRRDYPEV